MSSITNSWDDEVTVFVGGFGSDNIYGRVTTHEGSAVSGAKVHLHDLDNDEKANLVTGRLGKYEEDMNARIGHQVYVKVTFKDVNGNEHLLEGTVTLEAESAQVMSETILADEPEGEILTGNEPATREVKITPSIEFRSIPTLRVNKAGKFNIDATLRVINDEKKVVQSILLTSISCPGVLNKVHEPSFKFYVKRRDDKFFRYPITINDIKAKEAGEFTLTARASCFGEVVEKEIKVKVIE